MRLKEKLGVLLKDSPRYRHALQGDDRAVNGDPLWQHLCNRNEALQINPSGPGVRCPWRWTSDLHACGVLPTYGRQLVHRALGEWPVEFANQVKPEGTPTVSFIIAFEGTQRIEHLVWTVRSILAQRHLSVECIVIDQSSRSLCQGRLPNGVQYFHRPRPAGVDGWRKSWAFNQGAREASADLLVFHDGDIVCPADYAATLVHRIGDHGAASIQRFLFNMGKQDTLGLFEANKFPATFYPDRVRQNWEGGTIAVMRDRFFEIGGFDEAFVGWGGEDNEFFDRCGAIGHLTFGDVPFVHLWHPEQSDKHAPCNRNINTVLADRLGMDVIERIAQLRSRKFGTPEHPDPAFGYEL